MIVLYLGIFSLLISLKIQVPVTHECVKTLQNYGKGDGCCALDNQLLTFSTVSHLFDPVPLQAHMKVVFR